MATRYQPASASFFSANRKALASQLSSGGLSVLHSNAPFVTNADGTLPFVQDSQLYYLTGIDQEETILLLFPDAQNPHHREILFVQETNEHIAQWEGHKLSKEEAKKLSGIQNVQWVTQFDAFFSQLVLESKAIILPTNEHQRADQKIPTYNDLFIERCRRAYPLHHFGRLSPLINTLRAIKDSEEIKQTQKACDITREGFLEVLKALQDGVGEWELEAIFSACFLRNGSKGFAYTPIIASGGNACVLHYIENAQRCKDGDVVLMDVGAEYAHWNADMTRCVPVSGRFSPRQREVYQSVLHVLHFAEGILRPGITLASYQHQVLERMEEELIALRLIGADEAKAQDETKALVRRYFMHGTSHHLGLDVHDVPPSSLPVREGMLFTIEPGIYIPEEGLGIRLENNYWIGKDSNINLMADIPLEIEEIEETMAR